MTASRGHCILRRPESQPKNGTISALDALVRLRDPAPRKLFGSAFIVTALNPYIGYKNASGSRVGLLPGTSITVTVPLVFWDGARIFIGYDPHRNTVLIIH